jgi:hypothetical protein
MAHPHKKKPIKGGPVEKDSSEIAKIMGPRVKKSRGGGVGIQTHGNKLAKALNTKRPDQSLFQNEDGYLTGGIKIRS